MIAASIVATVALYLLFGVWMALFPEQAKSLDLGFLVIVIHLPILGAGIGIAVVNVYLPEKPRGARRVPPPELDLPPSTRPTAASRPAPRPRGGASLWDGIVFLVFALIPGLWSVAVFAGDWSGVWKQILSDMLAAIIFLVPVAVTIVLVVCGVATIRRSGSG